ncbi:glycosyltransferase [Salinarchaeum sp. IM2453]|uniref:glycosyltransferase n=1 Tax=Salinarchaeum sp. IM2453 TaxID=2862870 RepID=UPI001C83B260|nr:glycosyltransferase [Salinarchaeum sp. IM2453]QZA89073.1 glycosyltransferase [Salinarchaeum sp. IM2453]
MVAESDILGIGPLAPPVSGPGIKNSCIKKKMDDLGISIDWVDTINRRPSAFLEILQNINEYKYYIISVSTNGRLALSPVIIPKVMTSPARAALIPAGGQFMDEINKLPFLIRQAYIRLFNNFDIIYPQTQGLKVKLETTLSETRIKKLPNMRFKPETENSTQFNDCAELNELNVVYVGRLVRSKGLDELLGATDQFGHPTTKLYTHIYGDFVDNDEYKGKFLEKVNEIENAEFRGKIEHDSVITEISQYDAFVFPSYYYGEGFPGVIVEAYMAGLPVIATNWNYNSEVVSHRETGLLFDPKDVDDLKKKLQWLCDHPSEFIQMRKRAQLQSKKYTAESVVNRLVKSLMNIGWDLSPDRSSQNNI